jgi:hypothetical protein
LYTQDTSQDSEVSTTMHDAMWRGHGGWEMALTPALFGFVGWLADGQFGTAPVLTVLAALVGFGGSVANQYYRYSDRMQELEAERARSLAAAVSPGAARFGKTEEPA